MYKFILASLLIISSLSFGQSVKELALKNEQSILNDRIFLAFPDSAKNVMRPVDIMSHDPNENKETRIVFDNGAERLVFFAQELFMLSNGLLLETMKKEKSEEFDFLHREIKSDSELTVIQSTPRKWNENQGGILVNSLVVMTEDSTLIRIDAYINPEAYKAQKDNYIELTKAVFKTIKKGTRLNNRNARTETHAIYGTDKSFVFDLPKNSCVNSDQKYGFQVFRVDYYTVLGDDTYRSVSVYVGRHPSYFHPDYGFRKPTDKQKTTFLGTTTDWLYFEDEAAAIYLKEQKIEMDAISEGLIVHVALVGGDAETVTELTELIEKMELK